MLIARISALEEMVSGIAHELNQPIGAIATFAQTGERMLGLPQPLVGETREVLHHIGNEAMKAGAGIHRIRGLFRGQDIERRDCTMADVVTELQPLLKLLADRAGARLDIRIAPSLPALRIDRLRVQHVLITLVQNALEASAPTGATPALLIEVSSDKYAVVTSVSDTGVGISPEARTQLFRPFFTTKPNGTGLGLASSRAIVEAHEGTIGFEDAAGGGTRFWFRLPAHSRANAT